MMKPLSEGGDPVPTCYHVIWFSFLSTADVAKFQKMVLVCVASVDRLYSTLNCS